MSEPNILFIAVDDLRPELGCYGAGQVISPNIDRLAAEGVRFDRAYCQSAVCNPSRTSLLTGLYPDTHGVRDLYTHFRDTIPDVVTLPQRFKNHGYHSAAIGKIYHNDLPDPQSWSEPRIQIPGFPYDPDAVYVDDDNMDYLERRKIELTAEGRADKYIDPLGEWYLKASATEMPDVADNAYYDGAQTDVAVEKLAELSKRDEPFFFGVGYYRPHLPYNVPRRYWDMYDRDSIELAPNDYPPIDAPPMALNNMRELRGYTDFTDAAHPTAGTLNEDDARLLKHGYLASVTYLDTQIGKLLDQLDELGIRDNTIIVLWADHGWKLGEHASWCKMTNYEIDTRVPLIISAPGCPGKGSCPGLAELVDVYPTLCDLAGLAPDSGLQGRSLAPQLKDPDQPTKDAAFSQFYRAGIWQDPSGRDYTGYAIRTETHRYVEWFDHETKELLACELYDHTVDPDENTNIAKLPENAETIADLATRLGGARSFSQSR